MHRSIDRVWVSIGVPHVVKWSYLVWFPVESEILVKMAIFHTHLHSTPPLGATPNIVITFGTEWWGYHAEVEKVLRICLLISIQNTNDTPDIHRKSRFFSYPLHISYTTTPWGKGVRSFPPRRLGQVLPDHLPPSQTSTRSPASPGQVPPVRCPSLT